MKSKEEIMKKLTETETEQARSRSCNRKYRKGWLDALKWTQFEDTNQEEIEHEPKQIQRVLTYVSPASARYWKGWLDALSWILI